MQKSHDPRRDLIDTYAAAEHLVDVETHIAQSHCAAVNRDLLAALKWLVWAVDFQRVSGEGTDPQDLKAALVAARQQSPRRGDERTSGPEGWNRSALRYPRPSSPRSLSRAIMHRIIGHHGCSAWSP